MTGESLYPRDLIERLRSVLDERQTDAMAMVEWLMAGGDPGIDFDAVPLVRRWWYTYTPGDALRTIQAHRKILDRHAPRPLMNNDGVRVVEMQCSACVAVDEVDWFNDEIAYETYPCADVRDLASIYFPESDATDGR